MPTSGENEPIYEVGEVIDQINSTLAERFPPIWVTGEISNLSQGRHWYFDLVDQGAALRCAFWANRHRQVRFDVQNGSKVNVRVELDVYKPRGSLTAQVLQMELAGEGELRAEFERLKLKLDAEGLFADEHKRVLPNYPQRIAVVTAAGSAAFSDVVTNIERRYPLTDIVLVSTTVQGNQAPGEIVNALRYASHPKLEADVVLVTRGGGSFEDLNAFNHETVARAIYDCKVPVVSAVGHEIDFTIADFVADVRAPTPSTAAEFLTPDIGELWDQVEGGQSWLNNYINGRLTHERQRLEAVAARLRDPAHILELQTSNYERLLERLRTRTAHDIANRQQNLNAVLGRLDRVNPKHRLASAQDKLQTMNRRLRQVNPVERLKELAQRNTDAGSRIRRLISNALSSRMEVLQTIGARLQRETPTTKIAGYRDNLRGVLGELANQFEQLLTTKEYALGEQVTRLESVSPLNTIKRGYSVITKPDDRRPHKVVTQIGDVKNGESISARVTDGVINATVQNTEVVEDSQLVDDAS